jgi:hypothetical protein
MDPLRDGMVYCPTCREQVPSDVDYCPYCQGPVSVEARQREADANRLSRRLVRVLGRFRDQCVHLAGLIVFLLRRTRRGDALRNPLNWAAVIVAVIIAAFLIITNINNRKPVIGVMQAEICRDIGDSEATATLVAGTRLAILSKMRMDIPENVVILGISTLTGDQGLVLHPYVCSVREFRRRERAEAIPTVLEFISAKGDKGLSIHTFEPGSEYHDSSNDCTVEAMSSCGFWADASLRGRKVVINHYGYFKTSPERSTRSTEIICDPRFLYIIKQDGSILKSAVWPTK